jgi:WD40 repeat protein
MMSALARDGLVRTMKMRKSWPVAALNATLIVLAFVWALLAGSGPPAAQEQSIIREQTERSLQSIQGQSREATKSPRAATGISRDAPGGAVEALSLSRDGWLLAVLLADNSIRLSDMRSGAQRARLLDPLTRVRTAVIAPDGKHVMTGGENGTVALWDSIKGDKSWSVQGHEGGTTVAIALPDGSMATGGADGHVRIWSLESGKTVATLEAKAGSVRALAASRDNRYLVSGHADGRAVFWFRPSGKEVAALGTGGEPIVAVGFDSSTRPVIVRASGAVSIWTAAGDKLLREFQGPARIIGAAFSSDGQYVALGGEASASLYALRNGNLIREFKGPPGSDRQLLLDVNLLRLYMGGQDGVVRVLSLSTGASLVQIGESAEAANPEPARVPATAVRAPPDETSAPSPR